MELVLFIFSSLINEYVFVFWWEWCGRGGWLYIPSSRITCMFIVNFSKYYQTLSNVVPPICTPTSSTREFPCPRLLCAVIFQLFSWWGVRCFSIYLLYALRNTPSFAWVFSQVKGEIFRALYLWEINETTQADFGVHRQAQTTLSQIFSSNHHRHHHTTTIIAIWKDS